MSFRVLRCLMWSFCWSLKSISTTEIQTEQWCFSFLELGYYFLNLLCSYIILSSSTLCSGVPCWSLLISTPISVNLWLRDLGMQDVIFSIVCLKVLLIILLLCIVDGSVLQETKGLLKAYQWLGAEHLFSRLFWLVRKGIGLSGSLFGSVGKVFRRPPLFNSELLVFDGFLWKYKQIHV